MISALTKIKDKLYEVIRQANDPQQNLGPVLEQNLNIKWRDRPPIVIQAGIVNQSITVNIMSVIQDIETLAREMSTIDVNPLAAACAHMFREGADYPTFKATMRKAYVIYVISQTASHIDAATFLGMTPKNFYNLQRREVGT